MDTSAVNASIATDAGEGMSRGKLKTLRERAKVFFTCPKTKNFFKDLVFSSVLLLITCSAVFFLGDLVFASGSGYLPQIKTLIKSMIGIIGTIFQAVGVVFAVFAVGQMVLAFKNDDADSKSRATTMLVVGAILIFAPAIINSLKLVDLIGK